MNKILIFSTLFFYSLFSFSQVNFTLTGTIVDSVTNKPLEFCNVVFKNIEDTTKVYGCITNNQGKFNIKLPMGYNYLLTISRVGYETMVDTLSLIVETDEDEEIDFSQIPEDQLVLDLEEIWLHK